MYKSLYNEVGEICFGKFGRVHLGKVCIGKGRDCVASAARLDEMATVIVVGANIEDCGIVTVTCQFLIGIYSHEHTRGVLKWRILP